MPIRQIFRAGTSWKFLLGRRTFQQNLDWESRTQNTSGSHVRLDACGIFVELNRFENSFAQGRATHGHAVLGVMTFS